MSLKDEIERIAKDEQQKIEADHNRMREAFERRQQRFQELRGLVQELADSVDPAYLEARFHHSSATFEMGLIKDGERPIDVSWNISPQFEKSGFEVKETQDHYEMPEWARKSGQWDAWPNKVRRTETRVFQAEAEMMDYLVQEIGKLVGRYGSRGV